MNLIYGVIVDVFSGPEPRLGKVRVGKAVRSISLDLVADPTPGDKVLVCDGVAIGKVDAAIEKETAHVPGHSR
jgi:hydrogenase maturation factor